MSDKVQVKKTDSIFDELDKIRRDIMDRAYSLFKEDGESWGKDLDNWLKAEQELVWKPAIELEEKDNQFHLKIAAPGIDAKDLSINVTAEDLVVKGETKKEKKEEKGEVYTSELSTGSLFRSIHLPKKIDTEKVKAEFKNGILTITAPVAAEAAAKQITVNAA